MVDMAIEIKTSRAIAAQILRHRSFNFQEFSQRYSEATDYEDVELRLQGSKNRQVGEELIPKNHPEFNNLNGLLAETLSLSEHCYRTMVDNGIAKEVARMILPLTTQTTMYMKGSLRSWIHYIELRAANGTQKEHMEIARACATTITAIFPMAADLVAKD